jgi:RNA-directed DNA polymerase
LQHVLYRAARADPGRRFHALRDKVYCEDVLWRAWIAVRRNNGAPGIDKITLADVEEYGVTRLLGELAVELRAGTWRPMPARQVLIPKPGSTERRPLAIAAIRDRIVQAAVKIVPGAGLRGGLRPVQLRVPPGAGGARCPAGAHRRGLAGTAVGGRDGHRELLFRDSAR